MPFKAVIQILVNVVDRGGNMLLNVGPDADGVIPATHVNRLKEVGDWLSKNKESIYGTRPGPFQPVDSLYGSTHKGQMIYIHLINSSKQTMELKLPAIGQQVLSCTVLNGKKIDFRQDSSGITLNLGQLPTGIPVYTIALKTRK
jgi:alpha-L-fucosidase